MCDNQLWEPSLSADGICSDLQEDQGINHYSRRLSARLGEVAGDIAEAAGDLTDNSQTFDRTRRRLSARLCRVTVDVSENTEALLQQTTSAIRRSLSTGNNFFSPGVDSSSPENSMVGDSSINVTNLERDQADYGDDLSPQYDEGEDLESSIAKLRSLLEEKERTESGSFDSGHEDIAEIDIDLSPTAKELNDESQSLVSQQSKLSQGVIPQMDLSQRGFPQMNMSQGTIPQMDLSQGNIPQIDLSQGNIAQMDLSRGNIPQMDVSQGNISQIDVSQRNIPQMDLTKESIPQPMPQDGRLFISVLIPSAEVQEQNLQQFVLYFIQYEGVFLAPASPPGTFEYIVQTCKVNRRFSEFLNLQNRLENNNKLKMFLKGIKGPSKWFNLPFTKNDKSTVASRRSVLERWLGQLCDIPVINVSQEMREFLAYGSDGSIAYLRKSGSSQRINQFLARTVTGVFNSLKDVLPSFEGDELNENVDRPDKETKQGFFAFKPRTEEYQVIATFVSQPRSVGICEEDVIEYHLQQLQEWGEACEADQSPLLVCPRVEVQPVVQELVRPPLNQDDLMEDKIPVAAVIINLASDLLPSNTWMSSIAVNRMAKILTGNIIQDIVQTIVEDYCSEAGHIKSIRYLADFLWNEQQANLDADKFLQKWEDSKTSLCSCIGEEYASKWKMILSNEKATLELILDVVDTVLAHLVNTEEKPFKKHFPS